MQQAAFYKIHKYTVGRNPVLASQTDTRRKNLIDLAKDGSKSGPVNLNYLESLYLQKKGSDSAESVFSECQKVIFLYSRFSSSPCFLNSTFWTRGKKRESLYALKSAIIFFTLRDKKFSVFVNL